MKKRNTSAIYSSHFFLIKSHPYLKQWILQQMSQNEKNGTKKKIAGRID